MEEFSFFFDAIEENKKRVKKLKQEDIAKYSLERRERRKRRKRRYANRARAYMAIVESDPCVYCGGPARTIDHIVPRSKGGTSDWDNLAPACYNCNVRKDSITLLLFLRCEHEAGRI